MKLYQNRVKLTINGEEFTNNIPFPIKWNELLDNQLDEMSIELLQVQDRTFKPLSEVKVEIWNGDEDTPNNKIVNNYMVASDNANEIPSGSGKFNHSLSLIERTKWLERFICRSQGYVNPLAKNYVQAELIPVVTTIKTQGILPPGPPISGTVIGPQYINTETILPSWYELTGLDSGNDIYYQYGNNVEIIDTSTNERIYYTSDKSQQIIVNIQRAGVYLLRYRTGYYESIDGPFPAIVSAEHYVSYYVVFI